MSRPEAAGNCLGAQRDSPELVRREEDVTRLPAISTLFLSGAEVATHSSILAWKILWIEEPGRLQSMETQRVRQD